MSLSLSRARARSLARSPFQIFHCSTAGVSPQKRRHCRNSAWDRERDRAIEDGLKAAFAAESGGEVEAGVDYAKAKSSESSNAR